MTNKTTRQLIMSALFAAIIFLGVTYLKFELAPKTMVHLGNALVVISFLALDTKYSLLASATGLAIFDLLHGYSNVVIFTVLESVIVILVISGVYKLLGKKDTLLNVTLIGITAGIVKIIVIFVRRYATFVAVSGAETALPLTIARMTNTFITSTFTAIAVPLIYFSLKSVIERIRKF